jgi:glucose-6-phosphate isomerase
MSVEYKYKDTCLVDQRVLSETIISLDPYINHIKKVVESKNYSAPECSVILPFEASEIKNTQKIASGFDLSKVKYLVLVGIGGSNLGAQAVYEALREKSQLEILFADTVSQKTLDKITAKLELLDNKHEFILNVISKSGSTLETSENFLYLLGFLSRKFGNISDRVVATSALKSSFWDKAKKEEYRTLEIPDLVGGRYSVFSPVGLFPICVAGLNPEKFMEGGLMVFDNLDLVAVSATISMAFYKSGVAIHNNFFFNPSLEHLGKWQRQLTAESLGKNGRGILPLVSIGSTDLHSTLQLYLGGQNNILTDFIYSKEKGGNIPLTMDAIYSATKASYKNHRSPFCEFSFTSIDEHSLGFYMQFRMLETMLQAHLLNVNAFDQPNVEEYKTISKEILAVRTNR